MIRRPLGSSGLEASAVAVGAWAIGGWMWGGQEESDSIEAIHAALDSGINLIDTAPVYGFGRSEEVVGKALKGRRSQAILATKCVLRWDTEEGEFHFASSDDGIDQAGEIRVFKNASPAGIRLEVERSLQRLQTDHIDLLQTHWQTATTPIQDTVGEMARLKEEGKIRAIGACNATVEQLDEYAAMHLDTDQEKFSMLDQERRGTNLAWCREHGVAMLAYSPLSLGLLTGKLGPERSFPKGDLRTMRPRYTPENRTRVQAFLAKIQPIADAHRITLAQLAIAWTIAQPGCSHALVGARNAQQAIENAKAGTISLSPEELNEIDVNLAGLHLEE